MNERIKELLTECNYLTDGTCDLSREIRFAELIVRECLQVMKEGYKEDGKVYTVFSSTFMNQQRVKAHFGIKDERTNFSTY